MLLQLKNVYNALYGKGTDGKPFFRTKWEPEPKDSPAKEGAENARQNNVLEYFTRPSTVRWALPAFWGKVDVCISDEEADEICCRQDNITAVKNNQAFLELHFQPVYDEMKINFGDGIKGNSKENLYDLTGRKAGSFKRAGRTVRKILVSNCKDPQIIRRMVITQQRILDQYEYRACDFRSRIMGLVDSAMAQDGEEPDTALIETGFLAQLRALLLNLLSKGNDAAALACLLLCAALREDGALVLFQFQGNSYDILSLTERAKPCRTELGDDLYLTYNEMSNYMGGIIKTDITLWKYPATLVDKITDQFGYFFYPVQIQDVDGLRQDFQLHGPKVAFPCEIHSFQNGLALFEWTCQPDGRYFSDDTGFGAEGCREITLYAYMDKKGKFVTPFSVKEPVKHHDNQRTTIIGGDTMTPLNDYDETDITCIAGEGQRPEAVHPMVPPASEQAAFTGSNPGPASAAAEGGTQASGIPVEVQRSRGEELVNEAHSLHQQARIARARREYDAAAELEREAIAKLRQGSEVIANPQPDKREASTAVEKMNSGKDISFGNSLSLTRCEEACAKKADGVKNTYLLRHW